MPPAGNLLALTEPPFLHPERELMSGELTPEPQPPQPEPQPEPHTDAQHGAVAAARTEACVEEGGAEEGGATWLKLGALAALVIAVVLCIVLLPVTDWLVAIFEWIEQQGGWGIAFVFALYIPAALLSLPSSIVNLGCGVIWGRWYGTLVALGGYHIGAVAGLLAGRCLVRGCVLR